MGMVRNDCWSDWHRGRTFFNYHRYINESGENMIDFLLVCLKGLFALTVPVGLCTIFYYAYLIIKE